jgi:hypothetical protein
MEYLAPKLHLVADAAQVVLGELEDVGDNLIPSSPFSRPDGALALGLD